VEGFWYIDGVYNALKGQKFPEDVPLPVEMMKTLIEKGAKITACGICVNARGLERGKDFIEGVPLGGLPDFADMISESDVLVTL
jgi:tRNA 2-thiouridine synthesizing protein D